MTLSKKWSNFNFQKRVLKKKAVCCEYEPDYTGYNYFWLDYQWPIDPETGFIYNNEAIRPDSFVGDSGINCGAGGIPIFVPTPSEAATFMSAVQGGLNGATPGIYDIHIGGTYYAGNGGGNSARLGIIAKANQITFNYYSLETTFPPPYPETLRSVVLTNKVPFQLITLQATLTSQPFSSDINDLYFNGTYPYAPIGFTDQVDIHTFSGAINPPFDCLQNVSNLQGLCAGAFQGQPNGWVNTGFLQVYMNMLFGTKVVVGCIDNTADTVTLQVSNVPYSPTINLGPYNAVVRAPGCGAILGTVQFNWTIV